VVELLLQLTEDPLRRDERRTTVLTSDHVPIIDGLRVWTTTPGAEPGTVHLPPADLAEPGRWLLVHADDGTTVKIRPRHLTTRHPVTSDEPPRLGRCQWIGSCTRPALRMRAHPLMSPVPVCRDCLRSFPD